MEVYTAISDFTPPIVDGSQNILEFKKGDTFEIFDVHKTSEDWWGARAIETNSVGYVPSRYMQVIISIRDLIFTVGHRCHINIQLTD